MGSSMLEEKLLIWKFNRGDKEVLRRIYDKHKDALVTLAAGLVRDVPAAEDVVHDVFVTFIGSSGRFRLTGSLKGYLATCVANCARNRIKAARRHQNVELEQAEAASADADRPEHAAIFGEELGRLDWAMAQLPYEQREVLLLRVHSGLKFKAIAESQGVSISTVQGRYRYGMERLRSLLNSEVEK